MFGIMTDKTIINSQEELNFYIKQIENGEIYGDKFLYYGDYYAEKFPCVLGLTIDFNDYSMQYSATAYGVIVYMDDFNIN